MFLCSLISSLLNNNRLLSVVNKFQHQWGMQNHKEYILKYICTLNWRIHFHSCLCWIKLWNSHKNFFDVFCRSLWIKWMQTLLQWLGIVQRHTSLLCWWPTQPFLILIHIMKEIMSNLLELKAQWMKLFWKLLLSIEVQSKNLMVNVKFALGIIKHHAMKTNGKWRYSSIHS